VAPAVTLADLNLSTDGGPAPTRDAAGPGAIRFFGASAAGIASADGQFDIQARMKFSGAQLLVVKGKFPSFSRMDDLLTKREFKEVYMDLSGASDQQSRQFVMDLGANGLRFKREDHQPFDTVDVGPKSYKFDGEWGGKAKITEEEYRKIFAQIDEEYAQMLQALIAQLKKPS